MRKLVPTVLRPGGTNDAHTCLPGRANVFATDSPYLPPRRGFAPPEAWSGPRFKLWHAWLPFMLVGLLLLVDTVFGLDQRLADAVYAWEGHRWALKEAFATQQLVHRGGHDISLLAWCAACAVWAWSLHAEHRRIWRKPLSYLVLATLATTLLVAWIKSWSNMDCPWDLLRYGGERPFVGLFEVRPLGIGRARCFPAAHAGAGYAWLSMYFFLGVVRPRWRWVGLLVGLGTGLTFGVAQQLRGAHFLSHDLWTLAICWALALLLFRMFWPKRDPEGWVADGGAAQ